MAKRPLTDEEWKRVVKKKKEENPQTIEFGEGGSAGFIVFRRAHKQDGTPYSTEELEALTPKLLKAMEEEFNLDY